MRAGRLHHAGNHVLTWCIGDVVGKADRRGNLYPTKSRPDQKIDAAVALMMAVGRAMVKTSSPKDWMVPLQSDFWIRTTFATAICVPMQSRSVPPVARQSDPNARDNQRATAVSMIVNYQLHRPPIVSSAQSGVNPGLSGHRLWRLAGLTADHAEEGTQPVGRCVADCR